MQSSEPYLHAYAESANWFRFLVSKNVLTPKEIAEHGKGWIENIPRHGWGAAEYATMIARSDNSRLDEALAFLDQELQTLNTEKPKRPRSLVWTTRLILGKAECLLAAKQFDRVRAALDEYPDNAPVGMKNQRFNLLKRIDEAERK